MNGNITIINGNLLDTKAKVIGHQTNCLGIMGGGVALAIRNVYPNVYEEYAEMCAYHKANTAELLGHAQLCLTTTPCGEHIVVANLFGQNNLASRGGCATNYPALENALRETRAYMEKYDLPSLALPYGIGCGLAGGDWDTVFGIIEKVFDEDSGISVELWKLN